MIQCAGVLVLGAILGGTAPAAGAADVRLELPLRVKTQEAIDKALKFLVASQRENGGWEAFGEPHPAITALAVKALVQDPNYGRNHPAVKRGLAFVLQHVQPDGGIYVPDQGHRNYHTSVALMAFAAAKNPAHEETIRRAQNFLKEIQWGPAQGHETSSPFYGGQGYGRHRRPDLSNTQLMLEALQQSGLPPDDPAYQKAMVFVSRCQMLGSTNDQPFADGVTDGGFIYTPVGGGESMAGTEIVDGQPRLRSYGSMTYAGFKSMLYAQVDRDDERVQAALKWIKSNYTLDQNPNMPGAQSKEGLFYFYHVFAKSMKAWGEEVITDAKGIPRAWRRDLCEKLLSLQRDDGSWVNEADRWYEGNPHLVTAYAVLALQTALTP